MDETCPRERERAVIQAPLPGDSGGVASGPGTERFGSTRHAAWIGDRQHVDL